MVYFFEVISPLEVYYNTPHNVNGDDCCYRLRKEKNMRKANEKVYLASLHNKVPLWKLADCLGCHENTLLRRLRYELSEEKQTELVKMIEEIAGKEK